MCTGLRYFVDYPRDEWVAMDASMYDGKIDALLSNKTKRGNNALHGCVTGQGTPSTQQPMNPNSLARVYIRDMDFKANPPPL